MVVVEELLAAFSTMFALVSVSDKCWEVSTGVSNIDVSIYVVAWEMRVHFANARESIMYHKGRIGIFEIDFSRF